MLIDIEFLVYNPGDIGRGIALAQYKIVFIGPIGLAQKEKGFFLPVRLEPLILPLALSHGLPMLPQLRPLTEPLSIIQSRRHSSLVMMAAVLLLLQSFPGRNGRLLNEEPKKEQWRST